MHRSTYYRWKAQVDRQGLEMLRPRERRRRQMPNQTPMIVEQRIVAFSLGHPGLGPGGSPRCWPGRNGAPWRCRPTGCGRSCAATESRRAKRLGLIAGYRAPYEPPREPHIATERPGEVVGIDCFFVGRLADTKGAV